MGEEGISGAIAAAIESQKKNRDKSQRRKERAEKRKIETAEHATDEQPPAKVQKTNIIPLTPEHRKFIGEFFNCVPFYCSATKSMGVFSGFELIPSLFYMYPCLLGPTLDADGNTIKNKRAATKDKEEVVKPSDYVLACANPVNIFTGLKECFRILFPEKDEKHFKKWQAFRLNNEYYTSKVSGQAVDFKTYIAELGETKPLGGARPVRTVHIIEDIDVSRHLRAIPLKEHFKGQKLPVGIPQNAHIYDVALLRQIREASIAIKEAEKTADAKAAKLVSGKSFAECIENAPDSDSEDYSSE